MCSAHASITINVLSNREWLLLEKNIIADVLRFEKLSKEQITKFLETALVIKAVNGKILILIHLCLCQYDGRTTNILQMFFCKYVA